MRSCTRARQVAGLVGLGFTVAAGLLWAVTATGKLSYVTTHGASMQPRFEQGDLAVVRPTSAYRVGDVVAYHSRSLDAVVLHRIVARDGDRYVIKGDTNSWLDRDRPTRADLIGELWVRVPHGGNVLAALRGRTLFFALAALLLVSGGTATASRRHRPKGTTSFMFDITRTRLQTWRALTVGLGAVAVTGATLGVAGVSRPATTTATTPAAYTQAGEFSYSAAAPAGAVYETGRITTGDPAYLRLVPAVDVAFTYDFVTTEATRASGTIALGAELSDGTGWTRHVELQPARPFDDASAKANGRLAVTDLQALVTEVRSATGVHAASATVTLVPDVRVAATVDGVRVRDRFQPRLTFQLDPLQLRLAQPTGGERIAADSDDVLRPRQAGTVRPLKKTATSLGFAGQRLTVTNARRAGLASVPLALAALVAGLVLRRRLRPESARIELRHGHRIVPVASAASDADADVVDVTRMEDLVRLAEQEGCLILRRRNAAGDVYLFQADRTIYRYVPRRGSRTTRPASA